MDKYYIKLNNELVEIVGMDVANSKFAPINNPNFTGVGTIENVDESNDKSIVNIGHLKTELQEELANVSSRYEEVSDAATEWVTTLDKIATVSSVKDNETISLNPDSLTEYPEIVDDSGRVDNSRAGVIAIEGLKLLIEEIKSIKEDIELLNTKLTTLELGGTNATTRSSKSRKR